MYSIWIIFAYLKKTILKRKTDPAEWALLLACILDQFKKYISQYKNNSDNNINLFEFYLNEIKVALNITSDIELKEDLRIKIYSSLSKILTDCNFSQMSNDYYDILFPEEIDDIKIFSDYFYYKKNYKKEISVADKENFDLFFEDLIKFEYLDITHLFNQFSSFSYNNKIFYYKILFEELNNFYIKVHLKEFSQHLEINYNSHKNLYLKLAEEILSSHDQISHDYINDKSFHQSLIIITFFLYFNLLFIEDKIILNNAIYDYLTNLNSYDQFDFTKIYKLLSTMLKLTLPSNIKDIIKTFHIIMITHTLWQSSSFLYKIYLKAKDKEISPVHKVIKINKI